MVAKPQSNTAASRAPTHYGEPLLYVYGVIEPGTEAHSLLDAGGVPGIEPSSQAFPIEAAGLVAAASRVPEATFCEAALNALLADLPRLAPYAVRHQETVHTILVAAPALIPMAFGTIYLGTQRVTSLLQHQQKDLRRLLDRVRGAHEWGVKVFLDQAQLAEAADTASPALQELAAMAAAAGPGRAYLIEKRREQVRASEAASVARDGIDAMLARLQAVSRDSHVDALPTDVASSKPLVLKAAFLVEHDAKERFSSEAEALATAYGPRGLQIETSGPWAAYSFVEGGDVAA
jgi:hypothetical protein